ncbi:hypothetical protein HHI36_020674 [Cryptolaemus montrouzieri]|uniref:Gustatory receptor n=1 Tax=Cryptolaemus montrouzieri TaxID=559131 RepID=A0ABD2NAY2_9CUCU
MSHHLRSKNFVKAFEKPEPTICFCKSLSVINLIMRIVGINPLLWKHEGGVCVFQKSRLWLFWSIILLILGLLNFFLYTEFNLFASEYALTVLLNRITDLIYYCYVMTIMVVDNFKATSWVKLINNLIALLNHEGLFCVSAMKTLRNLIYAFTTSFLSILLMNSGILAYLCYSESYETKFGIPFILGKLLQNGIFIFYVCVFAYISVFVGVLTCFEKLSVNAMKHHKLTKRLNPPNNKQEIFFCYSYIVCNSEHTPAPEILKLPPAEMIEYFRILHEEICEIIYGFNNCMNPLLLMHMIIEIIVIVINWYSVIIKLAYDFKDPETETTFVLNLVFAITHTLGLFVFLRNAQRLSNMVQSYLTFLIEYSTKVSSPAEHLQIRIFIEKIKQHKPLTASGIFNLDLSIAGPIFANILTYVLVALQFKIPPEQK